MSAKQTTPGAITGETPTHYEVRVITSRGHFYTAKWAKDIDGPPSSQDILRAWDEDTMGGRVKSGNWRRS